MRLLHSRHPEMFFHHFVECVFHLNDYNSHPGKQIAMFATSAAMNCFVAYNKFVQSEKEKKVFSLRGNQRKSYLFLFL